MGNVYKNQLINLKKLNLNIKCISKDKLPKIVKKRPLNYYKLVVYEKEKNQFKNNLVELYKIDDYNRDLIYYFLRITKTIREEDLIEFKTSDYKNIWWLFRAD